MATVRLTEREHAQLAEANRILKALTAAHGDLCTCLLCEARSLTDVQGEDSRTSWASPWPQTTASRGSDAADARPHPDWWPSVPLGGVAPPLVSRYTPRWAGHQPRRGRAAAAPGL